MKNQPPKGKEWGAEAQDERTDANKLSDWVRDMLMGDDPKLPLDPLTLSGEINELFNELEKAKAALKKAQEERDDCKDKYEEACERCNRVVAAMDSLEGENEQLVTKAGLLLEEKQELEKQYKRVSELNGNQAVMVKEADKRRDEALKKLDEVENLLLTERLISARLEGYLEAIEDAKPPRMVAEAPGPGMAERITTRRQWAQTPKRWSGV